MDQLHLCVLEKKSLAFARFELVPSALRILNLKSIFFSVQRNWELLWGMAQDGGLPRLLEDVLWGTKGVKYKLAAQGLRKCPFAPNQEQYGNDKDGRCLMSTLHMPYGVALGLIESCQ